MTSNVRNLIIGGVVTIVVAAGAGIALSGGDDETKTDEVVATSLASGDDETTSANGSSGGDGSAGGSQGGSQGSSQGGNQGSSQGGNQEGGQGGNQGGDDQGTTTTTAQAAAAPTVNLIDQHCNSGKLFATVTASASNAYRKGVQTVTMSRKNDENADLTFNGAWYGPETGAGDQWHAELSYANNFGKTLRVVAKSDSNQTTTKEYPITVPC